MHILQNMPNFYDLKITLQILDEFDSVGKSLKIKLIGELTLLCYLSTSRDSIIVFALEIIFLIGFEN